MKMKITALMLASMLCMAGVASCGKDETVSESSVELKINATTTAAETTAADGETTTTGESTTTSTTTSSDASQSETTSSTEAAAETTTAQANEEGGSDNNSNNEEQQQNEQQQNNDNNQEQGHSDNEPEKKEVKFSIDDLLKNAADTVAALGGSPLTSTSPACTSNGCDVKEYDYSGELKIQCYIDGGNEFIFDYDILGGSYSTSKDIKIGSSRADVEAAYGSGEESGNMLIYKDGEKQLIFTFSGDTVSEIDFYVPV